MRQKVCKSQNHTSYHVQMSFRTAEDKCPTQNVEKPGILDEKIYRIYGSTLPAVSCMRPQE